MSVTRRTPLIGALAVVLVATACGTRLDDEAFVRAGQEVVEEGDGVQFGFGEEGGPATSGEGTLGEGSSGRLTTRGGSASGVGASGGGARGGGGGSAAGGGGPNTASDVGVTPTSIKVGNITDVNGLLGPEAFKPILVGAQAYFAARNDQGGVNDRRIEFITCDDRFDTERNKQCTRELIEQDEVFALVGNSTTSYAGASITNEAGVPDVGGAPIGNAYWQYPHFYSILGGGGYPRDGNVGKNGELFATTGTFRWFKQQLGVTKAAVFHYTIPISRQAGLFIADGLEREGIDVVYFGGGSDRGREATNPNYDSDVLEMKRLGVDGIWNAIDIAGFQKLCNAMDRQGFRVKANVSTVQGWGQKVGQDFSSPCRDSVFATDSWRNYAEVNHPAVAEFRRVMARYKPNEPLRQWHLWGYAAAQLLTEGVASMGANVTRAGLEEWLRSFTPSNPYTAGGLTEGLHWREENLSQPANDCFTIGQWQDAADTFVTRAPAFTCFQTDRYSYRPQETGGG